MIGKEQIIPLILEACPSFQRTFNESGNKDLLYVVVGDLARHLLIEYRAGRTGEFGAIYELIDRLHIDGEPYVKELATIGLLEGIQNVWLNSGEDPENFGRLLLPESRLWWNDLNDFWQGKIKQVGDGVHNKALQAIGAKARLQPER